MFWACQAYTACASGGWAPWAPPGRRGSRGSDAACNSGSPWKETCQDSYKGTVGILQHQIMAF